MIFTRLIDDATCWQVWNVGGQDLSHWMMRFFRFREMESVGLGVEVANQSERRGFDILATIVVVTAASRSFQVLVFCVVSKQISISSKFSSLSRLRRAK
jgi:hypothetical protein